MKLIILTLFVLVCSVECYNILVIFGHPGKSHYDVFKPLFQELGNRGHRLTIVSHVRTKDDIKNVRDVLLSDKPYVNILNVTDFVGDRIQKYKEVDFISYFAQITCDSSLKSEELHEFLKEDLRFDVVLTEVFNSNCFYGLITKYKAPFIGLSSCALMAWHAQWFGSPDNPSYIPSIYMAYPPPMSFLERAENTLMHLVNKLWYKVFMEDPGRALSLKYTGYEPADPYEASLLLLNTHHTLHGVRPFTPSIVEVGGIHVSGKVPKKLPQDIEYWTNNASAGLIYFSLGSMLKGHTIPKEQLQIFLKIFSKLPQRVLWKWEADVMEGRPQNVMLTKWAPQFDILCHPNTVLFITHGGLLGTTESVHCGVPMVVMPQFGDQTLNGGMVEKKGVGVVLKLKEATEESFKEAVTKALSANTRAKAKELSGLFKDRLVSPLNASVYWVEHLAKYKGANHMRSEAIKMPLYQYFLLDVILFYTVILMTLFYIIFKIFKWLLSVCFGTQQKVKTS
ncbi:UDP-glycosyltransferase UGT5-like [Anthonomus grandis grandis]|uniref:UDP-glycosyltransferase UGT5-like n=1 Tax=Anthonomus grandis grandis TaxID=2921223 RepID=UPI0021668096|nr:UDP-glycosyltransferase UGT5-like [Anthonomus grandis grandis]